MTKIPLKNIDGILLLDKPLGSTSNQILQRVKRLFGAKKAGHTGSLDPLATGMLPICFGEATKFSQFLLESDKSYQVIAKLGIKTTTGDAEGEIIENKPVVDVTLERIQQILSQLTGSIQQIPPMFSAVKIQGKPLYELARKGIEIERKPRTIHIYQLKLEDFSHDILKLEVHCSKGTYVRTLVEDIGVALGCGAHVIGLHRSMVVPYQNQTMYSIATLEEVQQQKGKDALTSYLLPIETSVASYPSVKLSTSTAFYLRTGQSVMVPNLPTQGLVRLFTEQSQFIGIGTIQDDGRLAPQRLITQTNKISKTI